MRLLLVTNGFPPRVGGVETLCRQLAEGLTARGTEVTVLTYGGPVAEVAWQSGYRVVRLRSVGRVFEWSWQLPATLRRERFDICHVHNLHAVLGAAVWLAGCRPYVLTAHYHRGGHTRTAALLHPSYRLLARRVAAAAGAVTAVSDTEATLLHRDFGVPAEVIPNGFEPAPRRPAPRAQPPTLVVVSRLVEHKRVDAVVAALTELPGYRLHIVGDGPEREPLLNLAARLGVSDRVRLTAHRLTDQDVADAFGEAAVHVNLSAAEAFSYTVLESLAAGTPVVVGQATALAEWAGRYPDAVMTADPDQPAQVAAAVRCLTGTQPDVDLGAYQLPAILDRYQQVYARVLGEATVRRGTPAAVRRGAHRGAVR